LPDFYLSDAVSVNSARNSQTFGNNPVGWGVVFGTLILYYLTECF